MEILKNPWKDKLMNLIEDSEESIRITSPFIKEDICKEILNHVRPDVCFELITDLPNAYTGALDLSGLELIIGKKGLVKSYPKLHSKIYIFDSKKAVITSGNLTNGGLLKNYEYGVLLDEFEIVSKIRNNFTEISKSAKIVKKEWIKIAREVKKSLKPIQNQHEESNTYIIENINHSIESALKLKGWKLSMFEIISTLNQEFTLEDVYKYEQELRRRYPENRNIRPKIRQQLQFLRDLGLIEFLSNDGEYRRLWR